MAYQGVDLRDLFRPGSGLTMRRLAVLIDALPPEAPLWAVLRAEHEKSLTSPERNRERAAYWERRLQKEEPGD